MIVKYAVINRNAKLKKQKDKTISSSEKGEIYMAESKTSGGTLAVLTREGFR